MYRHWVLTALLAWPVLAGLTVLLVPARLAKHVAFAASLVEFAISVPLWWTFAPDGGMQFVLDVPWIPAWGIRYAVGVDGISLFLVLLTTFLVPLSVLGSYSYITTRERGFYALMLLLTAGMLGVFVSLDLFLFYVMWEVMLIPMYFIIGVWGGENRLYAALKFFVYTFFGSLLMLVAILALVSLTGQRTGVYSFSYPYLMAHLGSVGPVAFWLFGAFFLAFAIKVPMVPFHTWLPGALCFLAGMLYERRHSRLIAAFGGIAKVVPLLAAVLTLVSLSSIGLPATNGFVGEFLILLGSFRTYPVAATIAAGGVTVAAMYLLPALQRVIYNPLDKTENERLPDLTPRELAVLLPLVACIVWIGVYPKPILERTEPAAQQFVQSIRGR